VVYATGSRKQQFIVPNNEVVIIDRVSPAPNIPANRIIIALSWIIIEDMEPKQAERIANF
jgi:hypothetical protein